MLGIKLGVDFKTHRQLPAIQYRIFIDPYRIWRIVIFRISLLLLGLILQQLAEWDGVGWEDLRLRQSPGWESLMTVPCFYSV